jgi:hypothetical protein
MSFPKIDSVSLSFRLVVSLPNAATFENFARLMASCRGDRIFRETFPHILSRSCNRVMVNTRSSWQFL